MHHRLDTRSNESLLSPIPYLNIKNQPFKILQEPTEINTSQREDIIREPYANDVATIRNSDPL